MNMNKVFLTGRISNEPKMMKLPSGTVVARVDIAYNHKYKDKDGNWKDHVSFFEIEAYGKTAVKLQQISQKGNLILIEGKLSQDIWEKDSKKYNKVRIKAVKVQLLNKPKSHTDTKQEKPEEKDIEEETIAF